MHVVQLYSAGNKVSSIWDSTKAKAKEKITYQVEKRNLQNSNSAPEGAKDKNQKPAGKAKKSSNRLFNFTFIIELLSKMFLSKQKPYQKHSYSLARWSGSMSHKQRPGLESPIHIGQLFF